MTEEKIIFAADYFANDLRGQSLRGKKYYTCNFANAIIDETTDLYGAEFHTCAFEYLSAQGAIFDHVLFNRCTALRMNAKQSVWKQSRALWTDFTGATFKDADVRTLETDHSEFYTSRIQLAKVNPYSRDMLAEILRVKAGDDWKKLELAAFIKCSPDLCWRDFSVMAKTENYAPIADEIIQTLTSVINTNELERYKAHEEE